MSDAGSYSYYDDDDASESDSSRPRRRKDRDRSDKRHSKRDKRDKRATKAKKDKKDKHRSSKKEKHRKKEKEKDRKRRRSPSSRSCSYSRGRGRDRSKRCSPRRGGGGGYHPLSMYPNPMAYGMPMMPHMAPMPAQRSPGKMPSDGRNLSLGEACESAGRGVTTGQTTEDDDVQVLDADDRPARIDKFTSFDDAREFPREIRDELKRAGFPAPSQIQAWTWPLGLKGKDIIGIAATGSGKTLAFLLPAFAEMVDDNHRPERDGPGLLVMSPTRELAQQTETEAERFGRCLGFRSVAMYGGAPKINQMSKYRSGVHTIVACPGRLNDFLEGGQVRLDGVRKLVLDEADRMLDMGFEPQIRKIMAKVPRKRHTLFFTATWPKEVRQLASEILTRPYKVMIGNRDELKGNPDIIQQVRLVDAYSKNREIDMVLREAGLSSHNSAGKALVFCNTKRMCENLSQGLYRQGIPCTSIHGDKDQSQRDDALNGLKSGRFKVLVATDVAARGLDIKGVGLVVNFDPANNTEDYVHRIGRTGRAGAKGYAITFLTQADAHKARGIVDVMSRTDQHIDDNLRNLAGMAPAGGRRRSGPGGKGGKGGKGGGSGGPYMNGRRSRSASCKRDRSPSRCQPRGRSFSRSLTP